MNRRATYSMVHGSGLEKLVSIFLGGIGAESKCLRQFALLYLSIINFGSMLGIATVLHAIGCPRHRSRSHDAVIRVYDESGNVIEMHEHNGDFKEW